MEELPFFFFLSTLKSVDERSSGEKVKEGKQVERQLKKRDKVEVRERARSRAKGIVKNIALYTAFVDPKSVDK